MLITGEVPPCRFPGCLKPCFVENNKCYDYCTRSHAIEHKRIKEAAERQHKSKKSGGNQLSGGSKLSSGTSGHQRNHQGAGMLVAMYLGIFLSQNLIPSAHLLPWSGEVGTVFI